MRKRRRDLPIINTSLIIRYVLHCCLAKESIREWRGRTKNCLPAKFHPVEALLFLRPFRLFA